MKVTVGIAQVTGQPFATDRNREMTLEVAEHAFADGADLVVLPELIVSSYAIEADALREVAESTRGPTVRKWGALAKARRKYIAGGFCEREGADIFNTAVLLGPEGLIIHYRKLHLFDKEKEVFTPGNLGLPIAETTAGILGLCICYDLRFVEVARVFALRGVQLIAVPTAWVPGFDGERWDRDGYCPQARGAALQANLNQLFIACASQAADEGQSELLGSSILADPYGRAVIGPLPGSAQQVVLATVDLGQVCAAQRRLPAVLPRQDRRTDVYGLWFDGARL